MLPQGYLRATTGLPQCSHRATTGLPQGYHRGAAVLPQEYHRTTTGVPQGYHSSIIGLPQTFLGIPHIDRSPFPPQVTEASQEPRDVQASRERKVLWDSQELDFPGFLAPKVSLVRGL